MSPQFDIPDRMLSESGLPALEPSDASEALNTLRTSALDLIGGLPQSDQRHEHELRVTLALAVSLIAVHGFGSIRVEECAIRAKDLSEKLRGSQNRFAAQRVA